MRTLIGSPYAPSITKLDYAFGGGPADPTTGTEGLAIIARGRERGGPIKTNSIPFRLVAGVPLKLMNDNPHRKGIVIQNLDPVTNLNVSFGTEANALSFALPPNSVMLLDFVCPTDSVSLFAAVAISGFAFEFARTGEAADYAQFTDAQLARPIVSAGPVPLAALPAPNLPAAPVRFLRGG